jgi:hypothetical protein
MASEPNVTLRRAVKYLVENGADRGGNLSRLGEHLGVSRQRVQQVAKEYRRAMLAKRPTLSSLAVGGVKERVS